MEDGEDAMAKGRKDLRPVRTKAAPTPTNSPPLVIKGFKLGDGVENLVYHHPLYSWTAVGVHGGGGSLVLIHIFNSTSFYQWVKLKRNNDNDKGG